MINEPVAWIPKGMTLAKPKDLTDCIPLYTHPAKEHFEDEPQAEELHEILQNNTHPAKELHLSLQKSKETGELLAVTYTDDEHRIVEVLWKKPPAKTLTDFEIRGVLGLDECWIGEDCSIPDMIAFARAILRKAQEK